MNQFRELSKRDESEKIVRNARRFFWRVIYAWVVVGLVLAFAGLSLLASHTAYTSAHAFNAIEKKTAEVMWNTYCVKALHQVDLEQIHKELGRPLNCTWAGQTQGMDLVEQSVLDANIAVLVNFSRYHLIRPWVAISIMTGLYLASLVVPALAMWYYFRETKRRQALESKALQAEFATIAQRASLDRVISSVKMPEITFEDRVPVRRFSTTTTAVL